MIVVNLYGGPGSGKSTTAAAVFANLKMDGYNVELVTEYAKSVVYEERYNLLKHQLYITTKQYKRLKDIQDYKKVPLVITDSPLKLALFYGKHLSYYDSFKDVVLNLYNEFFNYDVFVNRVKEYNTSGRMQTLEKAKDIDNYLLNSFVYNDRISGDANGINYLTDQLSDMLTKYVKNNK